MLYKWLLDSTAQVLQAQEFLELHSVPGAWRCLSVRSLPLRSLATLVGSDGLCVNEAPCETRCAQLLTGEALECDPLLGGGPGVRTPCHHHEWRVLLRPALRKYREPSAGEATDMAWKVLRRGDRQASCSGRKRAGQQPQSESAGRSR